MADDDARHSWTMAGIHTAVKLDGGVLVGDDGSACAGQALKYAAAEAARRGTDLHAVRAWSIPTAVRPRDAPFGTTPSIVEMQDATLVETRRRAEVAAAEHPGVTVHAHTAFGRAGRVLLSAAAGADVLVVGSKGRSKIADMLVGSTAAACIREAKIPVVVVR
ncbi:universal stress protein [Georgenia satyanarayanai]|uniref:universal stress protein n=1 Tax=Georgenia satyanarayanai TaxID=860221 RepID=UPI001264DBFF|nr:universal stress protein [Georgenia satyanarayanai]